MIPFRRGLLIYAPCATMMLLSALQGRAARAGTTLELRCTNTACNYHGFLDLGGAMMFSQVTGYCHREGKFVSLSWWRRDTPQGIIDHSAPPPAGPSKTEPVPRKIWSPLLGSTLSLHKCPTCPYLFRPIDSPSEIKFCPRCREATLEVQRMGIYD